MARRKLYLAETFTKVDYTDGVTFLAKTPLQAESETTNLEQAAIRISPLHKIKLSSCFKHNGAIFSLIGKPLKLVDFFPYLNSFILLRKIIPV